MSRMQHALGCTASPVQYVHMRDISRRGFLVRSVLALPILEACGSAPTDAALDSGSSTDAVELSDTSIRIRLARVPSLATAGGAFVIPGVSVIVLRVAVGQFRALSNRCTHSGCGISQFIDGQLRCQCHGSEFDVDGRNIVGPATEPLPTFATSLSDDMSILTIERGARARSAVIST